MGYIGAFGVFLRRRYSSNAADGLPNEASQFRRDAHPTRREVEARIREQERMLANRETGANKELSRARAGTACVLAAPLEAVCVCSHGLQAVSSNHS